jgi:hypothetical protein
MNSVVTSPARSQTIATSSLTVREVVGLLVALGAMGLSDLDLLRNPTARLLAALLALSILSPAVMRFWRYSRGIHIAMLWAVLGLSNLLSPLRNSQSAVDLTATFISAVTVYQAVQILGQKGLRRALTTYITAVLVLVTVARGFRAVAHGTFHLASLRVDSSAAGMWKGLVLLSPCPTRWLPGRVAFLAFKVFLLCLMLSVDRPKIGVLLSMVAALALGASILLMHRSAGTRSVVLACMALVPFAIGPALIVSNDLVREYGRRTDFSGRTVLWRATLNEAWNNNPITGVGFRNALTSSDAVAAVVGRFGRDLGVNAVHNVYIQLVAELGIVGLILVGWGLATSIGALLRAQPVTQQVRLAIDTVFVLGLCFSEPILEPSTVMFTLACLALIRARSVLAATDQHRLLDSAADE